MELDPQSSGPRRVEAYLDQVLVPLAHRLSPFHRDELRRELREHLWARVEAYQELGHLDEEAVTEALKQFGGADNFLRQWQRDWIKTPSSTTWREVWEAGKSALKPSLIGLGCGLLPFIIIHSCYVNLQGSATGALLYYHRNEIYLSWIVCALLLLPIFIGIRQGKQRPKCAEAGMLAALIAELSAAGLLYEIVDGFVPLSPYMAGLSSLLLMLTLAWIPIACGSTALGGWWTRRSQVRHLA